MTKPEVRFNQTQLLSSIQEMIAILGTPHLGLDRKLRRLTSIIVADFPRMLFKLQVIDSNSRIRVMPEFITPMLQRIVDRYRATLGPVDVRDMCLPSGGCSPVEAEILSGEEMRLTDPADITRYYAAHFAHPDRDRLGAAVRRDLAIREVLLLPVRPDERPFGLLSVSSPAPFGEPAISYWRTVAKVVAELYRQSRQWLVGELQRLALSTDDTPTILVDAAGRPIDVNRSTVAVLGFDAREQAMNHLGEMGHCLCGPDSLYVSDAFGEEIACTVETHELRDGTTKVVGAVIRLIPDESLEGRSMRLTRRQREVARLITDGKSSKEIAVELGLSVHTVNYHRAQIRSQLPGEDAEGDLRVTLRRYFLANP